MWVLWAGHSGLGYFIGRVLKCYPANIRLEPTEASDWRHECRREAIRAAFLTEAEAVVVVTALDQLAKLQPFGVFQGDKAPGRYLRLLEEARRHGFLPEPEAAASNEKVHELT